MQIADYSTLKVGDNVAVTFNSHSSTEYTVIAANKVSVTLRRGTDGNEKVFLIKSRKEKGRGNRYFSPILEPVADAQARSDARDKRIKLDCLWSQAASAASRCNMAALKETIAKIEEAQK